MAKLVFKYASMNAGKTANLIQTAYNFKESNKTVVILTSSLDTRYGKNKVASRLGIEADAIPISPGDCLMGSFVYECDVILVDEAQFLTKSQVKQLAKIVDELDTTVICYGLRTDFQGELFEGSQELLALADKLIQMPSVCNECTETATMNARLTNDTDKTVIGGNETYTGMCRSCFVEHLNKNGE
ncbi:thymidine kinase [Vibrio phage D479]